MFLLMPWKLGLDLMLTMMFKMLTSMRLDYFHRSTGLELDPVGAAAARQSEIDFAWRLKAFEPRPRTEAYQRMGRKPFGMRWIDCDKEDEQRTRALESFGRPRDTSD